MKNICLVSIFFILSSCSLRLKYHEEGECFKEIDKRYVSEHISPLYRVDKVKVGFGYWVSLYDDKNKIWKKMGRKKVSFFDDTDMFQYKKSDCPQLETETPESNKTQP
ncbi:MAG: hypothetical protein OXB84_05555 [Halobacteriovoraceae bacterium]|nr:hypothetical protein [Halobacteriovoraceae bacterium]